MSIVDKIGEKALDVLSNKKILAVLILNLLLLAGFILIEPPKPKSTSIDWANLENYHKEPSNVEIIYISTWGLHPDFIEVTNTRIYNVSHPGFRIGERLDFGLGSFFIGDKPFEIEVSPNIKDYRMGTDKFEYRGNTYDSHGLIVRLEKPSPTSGYVTYYVRFKAIRMPHLHGETGKDRLISIGRDPFTGPYAWLTVVAIPAGSEILSVYDFPPYKAEQMDGWQLFYYDTTDITKHESIHIVFNQTTDTANSVDVQRLFPELSRFLTRPSL